ncbi:MAG: hypothetical protein LBT00_00380 [Spirochaetaceae bacterium]|nr:hypothetical protein [Spirochaetaceae bacterium]
MEQPQEATGAVPLVTASTSPVIVNEPLVRADEAIQREGYLVWIASLRSQ